MLGFWTLILPISLCATFLCVSGDCSVRPFLTSLGNCVAQPHGTINTTADSWGVRVYVGDQEMCVSPSTVTNHTFLPDSDACANDASSTFAACTSRRGGLLSLSDAGSSFAATSSLDEILALNPNWRDLQGTARTIPGNVTLKFPPDIALPVFPVGIIAGGQNHANGHLGLAQSSVFLQRLVNQKYSATRGFSINAGSRFTNRSGHLVIGGYDRQSVGTFFSDFGISSTRVGDRLCPLQIRIRNLDLMYDNDVTHLIGPGAPVTACIEPYDDLFRLPGSIFQSFTNYLTLRKGWPNNITVDPREFLVMEPGLFFDSQTPFNGSFKFTLDGGSDSSNRFEVEIPTQELVRPLRGINRNGTRVQIGNITELAVFHEAALFDTAVLGKVFLSRVYLSVLYHQNRFRLAHLTEDAIQGRPSPPDLAAFDCVVPSKRRVKVGAVVGGTLSGALVLLLVLYFVWRCCCRPRKPIAGGKHYR